MASAESSDTKRKSRFVQKNSLVENRLKVIYEQTYTWDINETQKVVPFNQPHKINSQKLMESSPNVLFQSVSLKEGSFFIYLLETVIAGYHTRDQLSCISITAKESLHENRIQFPEDCQLGETYMCTVMVVISLFRGTKMAAVTPCSKLSFPVVLPFTRSSRIQISVLDCW